MNYFALIVSTIGFACSIAAYMFSTNTRERIIFSVFLWSFAVCFAYGMAGLLQ